LEITEVVWYLPPLKLIQEKEKNNTVNKMCPSTVIHPSMTHTLHCAFTNTTKTGALNTRVTKCLFHHKHGPHAHGITLLKLIWNPPTYMVLLPSNIIKYLK